MNIRVLGTLRGNIGPLMERRGSWNFELGVQSVCWIRFVFLHKVITDAGGGASDVRFLDVAVIASLVLQGALAPPVYGVKRGCERSHHV